MDAPETQSRSSLRQHLATVLAHKPTQPFSTKLKQGEVTTLPTPGNSSPIHKPLALSSDLGYLDDTQDISIQSDSDSEHLPTSAETFTRWLQQHGNGEVANEFPRTPTTFSTGSAHNHTGFPEQPSYHSRPSPNSSFSLLSSSPVLHSEGMDVEEVSPLQLGVPSNGLNSSDTNTVDTMSTSPSRSVETPSIPLPTPSVQCTPQRVPGAERYNTSAVPGSSRELASENSNKNNHPSLMGDYTCPVIVGRGRRCTLDLTRQHREVSRVHATIRWIPVDKEQPSGGNSPTHVDIYRGRFVMDITGRNGVKIGQQLYPPGTTIPLLDGQILDFVGVPFKFCYPVCAAASNSANSPADQSLDKPVTTTLPSPKPLPKVAPVPTTTKSVDTVVTNKRRLSQTLTPETSGKSQPLQDSLPFVSHDTVVTHSDADEAPVQRKRDQTPSQVTTESAETLSLSPRAQPAKRLKREPSTSELTVPTIPPEEPKSEIIGHMTSSTVEPSTDRDHILATVKEESSSSETQSQELLPLVIESMVFSSKRSYTVTDILHLLGDHHPHALHCLQSGSDLDAAQANARHTIRGILESQPFFGQVVRRSKDASNQTVEDLWYYEPSKDTDPQRRENYGGLVRSARRCTLKDNQYYFKPIPKHKPLKKWVYVKEKELATKSSTTSTAITSDAVTPKKKSRSDSSQSLRETPRGRHS
ncbi:hypothetical protein IWQ62_002164 [Dispira parvispora]|uniref:FHA domain-containing protein n=1 Tax=Dispira parvispora TaxID=1520584 RepID=A0A9W8AWA4_9FUNG|nr:hypothetical protein IWQ62_002164 [Dispira parvispora]